MEIRNLRTFIKVANYNSFSKAAAELGYTQSTVTTQIKVLETELNTQLFDRLNKTVKLTENGVLLMKYAKEIIAKDDEAKQLLSDRDFVGGELNIGVFESICSAFLPRILSRYHELYPKVSINIVTGTYKELEYNLNANKIDVMWFYGHSREMAEWTKIMDKEYSLVVVAPYTHPLAKDKSVTIEMLESEVFIIAEKCCGYRQMLESAFIDKEPKLNVVIEVDNTEIITKFIKAGLGLGVLPSYTVRYDVEKKKMAILNIEGLSINMSSQIFYHKNKWVSPAMRGFFDLCHQMEG